MLGEMRLRIVMQEQERRPCAAHGDLEARGGSGGCAIREAFQHAGPRSRQRAAGSRGACAASAHRISANGSVGRHPSAGPAIRRGGRT
jgi:hypothetical protein